MEGRIAGDIGIDKQHRAAVTQVGDMLSSGIVVSAWGYFLYIGVIDPNVWIIVFDMLRVCVLHLCKQPVPPLSETPHQITQLEEAWQRD